MIGCLLGLLTTRRSQLTRTWPARVTLVLAVSAALQAAFLIIWIVVDGHPAPASGDLLVGVVSIATGMQTVGVFALGLRATFTTAVTATLAILVSDFSDWTLSRNDRLRLLGVLVGVVIGALLSAFLLDHARVWAPALPFVLVLVLVVVIVASVGFADPPEENDSAGAPSTAPGSGLEGHRSRKLSRR